MIERKTLVVTSVEPIKKVGERQVPKLSFKAKDGDKELSYFTFRQSLFDMVKPGQTISADVDTKTREYEGNTYTDRAVVQIYRDGQPIAAKPGFRAGKSPEELDQSAKTMCLAYAKDLAVANLLSLNQILTFAEQFYDWVKGNGKEQKVESSAEATIQPRANMPTGLKVQNVTELKALLAKHKIPTAEAYEILSIKSFSELKNLDDAWQQIKDAKQVP